MEVIREGIDTLQDIANRARKKASEDRAALLGYLRGRRGKAFPSLWKGHPDYEDGWILGTDLFNIENETK